MIKQVGMGVLLAVAVQAQAAYECQVRPQDDIIITPERVRVVGASGDLSIAPNGGVVRDGNVISLPTEVQKKAQAYQAALRHQLPLIDTQVHQHLQRAKSAMDKVIVQEFGSESKVRGHLDRLSADLNQAMAMILEKQDDQHITFHHQGIKRVEQQGKALVEQALGEVIQDSLNELGNRSMNQTGANPLQTVLGGVRALQQSIHKEWNQQEADIRRFGQEVCERVSTLEMQRVTLLKALPRE